MAERARRVALEARAAGALAAALGVRAPRPPSLDPEDLAVEALLDELIDERSSTCTSPDAEGLDRTPADDNRDYPFTAAEARAAVDAVPHARAWLRFGRRMGGSWVPFDHRRGDDTDARRELVTDVLYVLVDLHRRAGQRDR